MAKRFGDLTKEQKDKIRNKPGNKGLTKKEVRDKYNARQEKKSNDKKNSNELTSSFFSTSNLNDLPFVGPVQETNNNNSFFSNVQDLPFVGPVQETTPAPTPAPTPVPTPAPTPVPTYTPENAFDSDAFLDSINNTLLGLTEGFQGQIGDLTTSFGTTISGLQDSISNQAEAYEGQIGGLQEQLIANQDTLNSYSSQITSLADQLRDAQEKARQVKTTDATYVGDNTAAGVRFNRSNNYNRGAFALGTSQLNRDNMNKLFKIGTVNL